MKTIVRNDISDWIFGGMIFAKVSVHIRFLIPIAIQILIYGCAIYHPQSTDIPLIDHKGELRIDAGASIIPSVYSTVSYGLTNRISFMTFASAGLEERYYFQFSPGFYKTLQNNNVI